MAQFRKYSAASAIALSIGLAACGGGGGGVSSTPFVPAPVTPPPPPPPPSNPPPIGAAATATVPNANLFPLATVGGPTMRAHSVTTYPLLQSVVSINDDGLIADAAAMDGGATLAFESSGEFFGDVFTLSAPGDGFTNVDLIVGNSWCYCEEAIMGGDDNKWMQLDFLPKPATSALSWTTYGFWNAYDSNLKTTTDAAFVTGYITPTGSVPITGSATYSGSVVGKVYVADSSQPSGITAYGLSGNASLNANFGNRSIAGNLTNMSANSQPWNSISLLGTISGGNFTGTTTATSAPEGFASLSGSATGTFAGLFFGPKAEELGAVWSLYDGSKSALGAIGAKTGP